MLETTRQTARKCREEGKQAWLYHKPWADCPYDEGTFEHHCWKAGYHQHVANEEQLWMEWSEE